MARPKRDGWRVNFAADREERMGTLFGQAAKVLRAHLAPRVIPRDVLLRWAEEAEARGDLDLARFLHDAATKGKAAAALWIPKGNAGPPQARQQANAKTLRELNRAIAFRLDPCRERPVKALREAMVDALEDYRAKRWPEQAILVSSPARGVSKCDDLFWKLSKATEFPRILSDKTLGQLIGKSIPKQNLPTNMEDFQANPHNP